MKFPRMPIEEESPEQMGYDKIRYNLTESSLRDRTIGSLGLALDDLVLAYADHLGHPGLRALVAQRAGGALTADSVILTAGAASALFTIAVSLLDKGDHIVVVRPNYATNLVTPRVLQCELDCLDLSFENGFALDLDRLARLVRPDTKLISITTPHNPTGVSVSTEALHTVIALGEKVGAHVLVDETYREMSFIDKAPIAATLSPRAISVCSLSKSYGAPGIRLGWAMSQDAALMHKLLCAKEQIGICGSVIDEEIGFHVLADKVGWLAQAQRDLRGAFETTKAWIAQEKRLEWVQPTGGCVCFPRMVEGVDPAAFYPALNAAGAYVGPGHWFEQSDRFFRLGYGWPTPEELKGGLAAISAALDAAKR